MKHDVTPEMFHHLTDYLATNCAGWSIKSYEYFVVSWEATAKEPKLTLNWCDNSSTEGHTKRAMANSETARDILGILGWSIDEVRFLIQEKTI